MIRDPSILQEVIDDAVVSSLATSDTVVETLERVRAVLTAGVAVLEGRRRDAGMLRDGLDDAIAGATKALGGGFSQAADRRAHIQEFRVALFGRTGVGKSSLIEAITRGDGATVSPGQGDHTEDIREVSWGPLLIVDMPGTLGAGRRLSREELERRTEAEVRRADLVLLAFDSQNQQDTEFRRAAEMVLRYDKPIVVVLNVKNANWRSPDPSIDARRRAKRDHAVHEQVTHLETELARIGLREVPIVAINTQRATFARCDPFRAPAYFVPTRDREVASYGKEGLETASNVMLLERVIVETIQQRCSELRRRALLGDLEVCIDEIHGAFARLPGDDELLAIVSRLLLDLGYPRPAGSTDSPLPSPPLSASSLLDGPALDLSPLEADAVRTAADRSVDAKDGVLDIAVTTRVANELEALEAARGRPFDAPTHGTAHRQVDRAVLVTFTGLRLAAHQRAENVVLYATGDTRVDFARDVLDAPTLAGQADEATQASVRELCATVDLGARQVAAGFALQASELAIRSGGRLNRAASVASRIGSITSSGALVVATTSFWNPGGWAAFGVAAGGFVASRLGRTFSRRGEQQRLEARAASLAEARRLVDESFDAVEHEMRCVVWASMTTIASAVLPQPLRRANDLAAARALAEDLAGVPLPARGPAPVRVLHPASLVLQGAGWRPPYSAPDDPPTSPGSRDFGRLAWTPVGDATKAAPGLDGEVHRLRTLAAGLELAQVVQRIDKAAASPPRIALCGDYSSAKSSLYAVLTRRDRASRCEVRRGADRTTSHIETGPLGRGVIVDTPGFGSSNTRDAEVAEWELDGAALIVYLVTPRLIAALPLPVVDELSADSLRGKHMRARTRFALTRIDELGVLPDEHPEDFVAVVQNKRDELARILTDRGIPTSIDDVMALSPDPFGTDFDDEILRRSAGWSGVDRLRSELSEIGDDPQRRTHAAFASGLAELDRARATAAVNLEADLRAAQEGAAVVLNAVRGARDTRQLAVALTNDLRGAIAPVLRELVGTVMATQGDAQRAAIDRAKGWLSDPRVDHAVDRWQERASAEVDDHLKSLSSELGRQLDARPEFTRRIAKAVEIETRADGRGGRENANAVGLFGGALRGLDNTKVLALRDGLKRLPIPAETLKFRPWGAHKLAQRAQVAGKAAAALGLALEVAAIVSDAQAKRSAEGLRTEVQNKVQQAANDWVDAMTQGEEADGPIAALRAYADEVLALADQAQDGVDVLEAQAARAAHRISSIDDYTGNSDNA